MMCLTERDLRLMVLLLDVNYLSTSQLAMLGWGSPRTRAAQKRLKVLHDGGYLDRFRPVRRIGSAEWIYRLSARGWKALTSQEMVDGSRSLQAGRVHQHQLHRARSPTLLAHPAPRGRRRRLVR